MPSPNVFDFIKISLYNESQGSIKKYEQTERSIVLNYPCDFSNTCTPYVLELERGSYRFECWGSSAEQWVSGNLHPTPGLGAYTAGNLFVKAKRKFFVLIGNQGRFNCLKESVEGFRPAGGATDIRLNYSNDWWEHKSLLSRIMVAAGGGSAEWSSFGGHAGGLIGGSSRSARAPGDTNLFSESCKGATQTQGTTCPSYSASILGYTRTCKSGPGTFGQSGFVEGIFYEGKPDYGGLGGGGYYGGSSYQ